MAITSDELETLAQRNAFVDQELEKGSRDDHYHSSLNVAADRDKYTT